MKRLRYGRYETLRLIASGGMGSVHVARALGPGGFERLVAIKVMHDHIAADPEFSSMFLDEARLAAKIRHPNVVPTLDVAEDGQFIVLELVEGASLRDLLLERKKSGAGPIPLPVVVRLILDVLDGLHAAHELTDRGGPLLKLVHRDISPHNILLGSDGVARITDFGIAFAEARLTCTRRGQLKGKMPYMAPEQLEGGAIDRRVDIYAAGCVLWEMLTGKRLFAADNEAALACQVLAGPKCSPREIRPEVPRPIEAACMQALGKLGARFTTAAAFAEAIDAAAGQAQLSTARPRAVAALIEGIGLRVSADMLEDENDEDGPSPSGATPSREEPVPPSVDTATIDGSGGPTSEDMPAAVRPVAVGAGNGLPCSHGPAEEDSTEASATGRDLSDSSPPSEEGESLGERTSMAASLSTLPAMKRPATVSSAIVAAILASLVTAIVVWLAVRTPEPGDDTTAEAVVSQPSAASSAPGPTLSLAASAGQLTPAATNTSARQAASAPPVESAATSRPATGPRPSGRHPPATATGKGTVTTPRPAKPPRPAPSSTTFHPPSL